MFKGKYTGTLIEDSINSTLINADIPSRVLALEELVRTLQSGSGGGTSGGGTIPSDLYLSRLLDDIANGLITFNQGVKVGRFVTGVTGGCFTVGSLGQTSIEVDRLYVRLKAYFETLEIIHTNSVRGRWMITPGGSIKIIKVETNNINSAVPENVYRCYFDVDDGDTAVTNPFAANDLIQCKSFNIKPGIYQKVSNKYYWRAVVGTPDTNGNYVDLSMILSDTGSDVPEVGDVICLLGNTTNIDRLSAIVYSTVDTFSPSCSLFLGINDFTFAGKDYISYGVNATTKKAFFNVYGDTFIGSRPDAQGVSNSYVKYTTQNGVELKGKLAIGTTVGGKDLKLKLDELSSSSEDYDAFKLAVLIDLLNILNLVDGAIETWYYEGQPSNTAIPENGWLATDTTNGNNNIRNSHIGDLYYDQLTGKAYRYQYDVTNEFYWRLITDTDIIKALEDAKNAQDTADSKRKIFVVTPTNDSTYDIGDMWLNATYPVGTTVTNAAANQYYNETLRAVTSKDASTLFNITHWILASKYTDDTVANEAIRQVGELSTDLTNLGTTVSNFLDEVNTTFKDGIINELEKATLNTYINNINTTVSGIEAQYNAVYDNSLLNEVNELEEIVGDSVEKIALNNAWLAFVAAKLDLLDTIASVIFDNIISTIEIDLVNVKFSNFNNNYGVLVSAINAANNYMLGKLSIRIDNTLSLIGTFNYLKEVFAQKTEIVGGLVLTSVVALRDSSDNITAGINGQYDALKGDKTTAIWFGGANVDMFDYLKLDGTLDMDNMPANHAKGMDRMDGSGYRANGNLWWDTTGKVHADPLSFFVGDIQMGLSSALFLFIPKGGVTTITSLNDVSYVVPQLNFNHLTTLDYLLIGSIARIKYNSANNAIYIERYDGTPVNFYATGGITAYGLGSIPTGDGGVSHLYELEDVTLNLPTNGLFLKYNGTSWVNADVVIPTLSWNNIADIPETFNPSAHIHNISDITNLTSTLNNKADKATTLLGYGITDALLASNYNASDILTKLKTVDGAGSGLDADTLDGIHYQNILERSHSGLSNSGTATGWFRIGATKLNNATGQAFILKLVRNYLSTSNEAYTFSISAAFNGGISITQLSGFTSIRLIDKIRLDYTNSGSTYIDIHISTSTAGNAYYWTTIGGATSYNSWTAVSDTPTGTAYEFTPVNGVKSNRGFTGDLSGNSSSATKLQTPRTIWGQSFNGSANITGELTNVTNITASGFLQIGSARLTYDAINNAFYVQKSDGTAANLLVSGGITAYGTGSGGSGGGGLIQTVYGYTNLGQTFSDTTLSDTFNAYTINEIAKRLTLVENGALTSVDWSIINGRPSALSFFTNDSGFVTASIVNGYATQSWVSSNFNNYVLTKSSVESVLTGTITSHTHSYLPLAGGTLSGQLILDGIVTGDYNNGIRINRDSVGWSSIIIGGPRGQISGHNGTTNWFIAANPSSVFMINPVNSSSGVGLDLYRNGEVQWRGNVIYHQGNLSKSTLGLGNVDNTADASKNVLSATKLATARTIYGQSFDGSGNVDGNITATNYLRSDGATIWHSGNDGSGSGLDADLLDGINSSDYDHNYYIGYHTDYRNSVILLFDINAITTHRINGRFYSIASGGGGRYISTDVDLWYSRWTTGFDRSINVFNKSSLGSLDLVTCVYNGTTYLALKFDDNVQGKYWYFSGTGTESFSLVEYYNSQNSTVINSEIYNSLTDVNSWNTYNIRHGLKSFAYTDSNVASATKLQTTRTIWGQNFDGSGNVDGTLYIDVSKKPTNNYTEGIRIKPSNNWSMILLGGSDLTLDIGNSTNSWGIYNNNGNFYINRSISSYHTGYELCNIDGNWGINTVSPGEKLDVIGNIRASGSLRVNDVISAGEVINNAYGVINVCRPANTQDYSCFSFLEAGIAAYGIGFNKGGSGIWLGDVVPNSKISGSKYLDLRYGLATFSGSITANGNILATGGISCYSDERLKSDIKPLENRGYLSPVTYIKDGIEDIGFIAQEVRVLYPELVKEGEYLSLNYQQITAVLEAQIIELRKEINNLNLKLNNYGI